MRAVGTLQGTAIPPGGACPGQPDDAQSTEDWAREAPPSGGDDAVLTSLTWKLFKILTSGHWITERVCVEFQGATVRSSISEGECVGIYRSTIDAPDQGGVSSNHKPGAGLGLAGAATEVGTALLTGAADQFTRKTKRRQPNSSNTVKDPNARPGS